MHAMTLYVADGDTKSLTTTRNALENAGFHVLTFTTGESLGQALPPSPRGCIVSAPKLPDTSALDLVGKMKGLPVVVWARKIDVPGTVALMRDGVAGVVEHGSGVDSLVTLVRQVLHRERSNFERREARKSLETRLASLTDREVEVLGVLALGKSNRATGAALGISPRTVEVHRGRVMGKMQAGSMTELVRNLVEHRLHEDLPLPDDLKG